MKSAEHFENFNLNQKISC